MPTVEGTGEHVLAAITDALVALHLRHHHRVPGRARTQMLGDDLIACVMGDVYTDVEKTMIELQQSHVVADTRTQFQNAMQQRFVDVVQRLSGRRVLAFISSQHVGPDVAVELFMLAPRDESS